MKNPARIRTGLVAALWMFMGTHVMGQGSLTPPGAPGETMKSLEQVEPRTPISSLPYTITESGSYYVTGNLSSTTNGIVIEASGVTVDLMGFSITGDGSNGDYGIYVDGSTNAVIENLVIKGGRIGGFFEGLYCRYMNNSRIEQMVVSDNTDDGVTLYGRDGQCNGNTIADCTISGNGIDGVSLYNGNGQCKGNTIQDNRISQNTDRGINLFTADGNRVEANNIWGNVAYGIYSNSAQGNFVLKNTCVGNGTNYELDSDDTFGPIVEAVGELGSADGAWHPWANFSR